MVALCLQVNDVAVGVCRVVRPADSGLDFTQQRADVADF